MTEVATSSSMLSNDEREQRLVIGSKLRELCSSELQTRYKTFQRVHIAKDMLVQIFMLVHESLVRE